jgi:predicted dehydrogenase
MTPRRLALLGFGHVAEHGHLPAWLRREDFSIVAVADRDAARRATAQRLLPSARLYDDPLAALADQALDAVDIATPPAAHASLIVRAAQAGCHVLCEKPLVTTLADCRAAVDAARRAGVALFTVHNWKHSEQFRELATLLAAGAVGQPTQIRLEATRTGKAVSVGSEWRGDAALAGGGIFVDHGWHALYLLLGLAAETPLRIRATIERRRYTDADVEDTAACEIEFASRRGEIFLTWAGTSRANRWQVVGTAGSVTLVDDRGELVNAASRRALAFAASLSEGSHHPDWFGAVIDDFVSEIRDPSQRGRNLAEAQRCAQLTALAYESGRQGGQWLDVPVLESADTVSQRDEGMAARVRTATSEQSLRGTGTR